MPPSSFADVHLVADPDGPLPALDRVDRGLDRDKPFRILVIGDFGAQATARPMEIDRENFDDVLESFDVRCLDLRFLSIADFHPDSLYRRVPIFARPTEPRPSATPAPAAPRSAVAGVEAALSGSLLDAALEATEARSAGVEPPPSQDPFAKYVRSLVEPHLTAPKQDPADTAAAAAAMRGLLHHPRFQQIESVWRGLHMLVHELESVPGFSIHVFHMTKSQLLAGLGDAEDLRNTEFYRILTSRHWAVVAADYQFDTGIEDLNLIGRIGMVAKQAKTAFLAAASPRLLGCQSLAESPYPEDWNGEIERQGWDLIRSLPEARNVGLIIPRFLLRMPYGKEGQNCDAFPFEEIDGTPRHEDYLWGNGAFIGAYLLGMAYAAAGWQMRPGSVLTLPGRPMHVYREAGDSKIKPCTEVFLTAKAIELVHEHGLMALVSFPNSDEVRLAGFRSIASPAAPLEGSW